MGTARTSPTRPNRREGRSLSARFKSRTGQGGNDPGTGSAGTHLRSLPVLPTLSSANNTAPVPICSLPPPLAPSWNAAQPQAAPGPAPRHTGALGGASPLRVPSPGRGRAALIDVCTSPFLQGRLLSYLTSSSRWHWRRMMQFAERCRHFSPPPPGIFLSLVVLGIHPMFL